MDDITRRTFFGRAAAGTLGAAAATAGLPGSLRAVARTQRPAAPSGPRADWLALTDEAVLEPELPVIDPHHHLWERPGNRYLLDELLEDTNTHNVRQTVFVECSAMYRADGPEELRVVGETEFVEGIAAMSASGQYGETRVATGIVGSANLLLGDRVAPVLEAQLAASPQRFRGVRHRAAWAEPPVVARRPTGPEHLLLDPEFRRGYAHLRPYGLTFEGWVYHTHIADLADLADAFPDTIIIFNHLGGPIGIGPYAGRRDEVFGGLETGRDRAGPTSERGGEGGRDPDGRERPRLARARPAADLGRVARGQRRLVSPHHRGVRAAALHVREQLPGRQAVVLVHRALEPVQEADAGVLGRRAGGDVPRHRVAGLPAPAGLTKRREFRITHKAWVAAVGATPLAATIPVVRPAPSMQPFPVHGWHQTLRVLDAALPQHPGARVVVGRRPRELAARDGAAQARQVTAVKMAAQVGRRERQPAASWRMGRDLGTHRCQELSGRPPRMLAVRRVASGAIVGKGP